MDDRRNTNIITQICICALTVTLLLLSGTALSVIFMKREDDDRLESLKSHYTKLIRDSEESCEIRLGRVTERFDAYTYTTDVRLRMLEREVSSNDNKNIK